MQYGHKQDFYAHDMTAAYYLIIELLKIFSLGKVLVITTSSLVIKN